MVADVSLSAVLVPILLTREMAMRSALRDLARPESTLQMSVSVPLALAVEYFVLVAVVVKELLRALTASFGLVEGWIPALKMCFQARRLLSTLVLRLVIPRFEMRISRSVAIDSANFQQVSR